MYFIPYICHENLNKIFFSFTKWIHIKVTKSTKEEKNNKSKLDSWGFKMVGMVAKLKKKSLLVSILYHSNGT